MPPKLIYLIPGLYMGGAEKAFLTIYDNGFFDNIDLYLIALVSGSSSLKFDLDVRGIRYKVLKYSKKNRFIYLLREAFAFREVARDIKPDILIMSLPLSNLIGRFFYSKKGGVYRITFEHSIKYSKNIYNLLLGLLSDRVEGVMADSLATLGAVEKKFPQHIVTWKIPIFALAEKSNPKTNYRLSDPIRILSVGRLVHEKNYDLALELARLLLHSGWRIEYTIIGDGPCLNRLIDRASFLGVNGSIKFKGELADWSQLASSYDIFLHTSKREGLCLAVVEAMSYGLPVVCANVGGVGEYASNFKNVVFSSGFSSQQFLEALESLLNDSFLREKIGRQAVSDIRSTFSREKVSAQLRQLNNDMLHAWRLNKARPFK